MAGIVTIAKKKPVSGEVIAEKCPSGGQTSIFDIL
jgi:hypothetical protein